MWKRVLLVAVVAILIAALVSCGGSIPGVDNGDEQESGGESGGGYGVIDPEASKVVEDFVNEMKIIRETYPNADLGTCSDQSNPIHQEIMNMLETYYYFDDSLSNFSEKKEGAQHEMAEVLCSAIDEIKTAQVQEVKPTEAPSYLPKELQDEYVQALAPVVVKTISEYEAAERCVIKIAGKWYINSVYYA